MFFYQKQSKVYTGAGELSLLPDVSSGSGSLIVMQDLLTSVGAGTTVFVLQ